jgi:hypothetical protein
MNPSPDNRFCLDCGYSLRGLLDPRCPECGRVFDPADPKTWSPRPPLEQRGGKAVDFAGNVVYWGCALPAFLILMALMLLGAVTALAPVIRMMFQ